MSTANTLKRMISVFLMTVCLLTAATIRAEGVSETTAADGGTKPEDFRTVGNIVTFGHYEQDNDMANGPEAIEWIVLDVQGDKALLLSRYGLDSKRYNERYQAITWENCTLRKWLNEEFLNTAFDGKEQAAILLTEVENSPEQGNSEWAHVESGNNTQDRVFLLSCAEANRYLDVTPKSTDNVQARVVPTAYAIARGAWTHYKHVAADGSFAGRWWLRSPGRYEYRAAHVIGDGSLKNTHVSADKDHYGAGCVRPAIWLDLKADNF